MCVMAEPGGECLPNFAAHNSMCACRMYTCSTAAVQLIQLIVLASAIHMN